VARVLLQDSHGRTLNRYFGLTQFAEHVRKSHPPRRVAQPCGRGRIFGLHVGDLHHLTCLLSSCGQQFTTVSPSIEIVSFRVLQFLRFRLRRNDSMSCRRLILILAKLGVFTVLSVQNILLTRRIGKGTFFLPVGAVIVVVFNFLLWKKTGSCIWRVVTLVDTVVLGMKLSSKKHCVLKLVLLVPFIVLVCNI